MEQGVNEDDVDYSDRLEAAGLLHEAELFWCEQKQMGIGQYTLSDELGLDFFEMYKH